MIDNEEQDILELVKIIKKEPNQGLIVFCEKKSRVEKVVDALKQHEIKSLPFEESMSSQSRNLTLSLFKGGVPILICDKLGARGLDF